MESQLPSKPTSHYTVFIRLPFERGDFVDPPPVEWDAAKDKALWKVLSRLAGQDTDWKILAEQFDVSLPFLLQQAAWLYDRQLSQVRAQVRRVGTKSSLRPGSSESVAAGDRGRSPGSRAGNVAQEDLASSRADTRGNVVAASLRRDATIPRTGMASVDINASSRLATNPLLHLTPTDSQGLAASAAHGYSDVTSAGANVLPPPLESRPSFLDAPSDAEDDTSLGSPSDLAAHIAAQSRMTGSLRHFDMLSQSRPRTTSYHDLTSDDGEDSLLPAFLPLAEQADEGEAAFHSAHQSPAHFDDPNATILGSPERGLAGAMPIDTAVSTAYPDNRSLTSTSNSNSVSTIPDLSAANSTGSVGAAKRGTAEPTHRTASGERQAGPQRAALQSLSPVDRTRAIAREETESLASTASSFSDLEDASVTRSALEEAYLSGAQSRGIASRVGTIGQAFRSRYLSR